jgi:hypothetical protein
MIFYLTLILLFKVPERNAPEGGGEPDCHALAGGLFFTWSFVISKYSIPKIKTSG